jgi:Mg-chelatase subunit ChlI
VFDRLVQGRGGAPVAAVHGPQGYANATLIAAAPDLLERLRAMVSGAECECDKQDAEHPLCDICWSRQVIDKAEGRTE